jgi:hypothetical protein
MHGIAQLRREISCQEKRRQLSSWDLERDFLHNRVEIMKYVRNMYRVWEWFFDSPTIQGEQSNGGNGEDEGLEK